MGVKYRDLFIKPIGTLTDLPCYGCKNCVHRRTPEFIGYFCIAKSKTGRCIYKIKNYIKAENRELLINGLEKRIRVHVPPKWCPEEKKGE